MAAKTTKNSKKSNLVSDVIPAIAGFFSGILLCASDDPNLALIPLIAPLFSSFFPSNNQEKRKEIFKNFMVGGMAGLVTGAGFLKPEGSSPALR